jgi:hypothetical protein
VHVVVDSVRVNFFVVQHVLDEIFDTLHTHHLQFLVIHQDALALGERCTVLFAWRLQVSSLGKLSANTTLIAYDIAYDVQC